MSRAETEREAKASTTKATATADKFHPAVMWLPELSEAEYHELRDDIKARGLREPILRKSGFIIDGRHRLKACRELGIEPKFQEYTGIDILAEILSRNLLRRHLTADQRAMLVAKVRGDKLSSEAQARMKSGVATYPALKSAEGSETAALKSAEPGRTDEKIAKEAAVGRDKARAALDVVEHAPEDVEAVIKGEKKLRDVRPKKKRTRRELPPYEPSKDEQTELDAIEKLAGKLAKLTTFEITKIAAKLDSVEKQRWLDTLKPIALFFCRALAVKPRRTQ